MNIAHGMFHYQEHQVPQVNLVLQEVVDLLVHQDHLVVQDHLEHQVLMEPQEVQEHLE